MASEKNNTKRSGIGPGKALCRAVMLLGAVVIAGSGAVLAADGEITFQTNGIGVEGATPAGQVPSQINHQSGTVNTEAIAVDFGAEAILATVVVSNLFPNERSGERGKWEAFDGFGNLVGASNFELVTNSFGPIPDIVVGTNPSAPFRYLVFTALPYEDPAGTNDSSDYFVRSITYTLDELGANPIVVGGSDANETDWEPLNPTGFALGVPYLDENGGYIGAEPIVVNTQECTGTEGNNTAGCVIQLADGFTLSVKNSPDVNGSFSASVQTIVDPRASCGNTSVDAIPPGVNDDILDLGFPLDNTPAPVTGPKIPAHLCGTPNPAFGGQPTFELVNVNSQLTVITSVLELIAANDTDDDYNCLAVEKSKRPVVAWLPKTSRPEIPVLDAQGNLVSEIQDVTFACGSSRGGSSRFSFLAYDLRHIENAPYVAITRDAITQLNATILQTDACVDKIENKAVKSRAKSATDAFDTSRYSTAKRQYIKLLATVSNEVQYEQCLFDLDNKLVFVGNPAVPGEGNLPRNFRGDLIVQIQHILYMIDRMLDETKPALPEF